VAILDRGKLLHVGPISELTRHKSDSDVRIVVAGPESALRAALGEAAEIRPVGVDQFEVLLRGPDQAAVDRAIDLVRGRSLSLVSLTRRAQTLEEAFLGILQQARSR
jgi:hypothetical protein